MKPMTDAEAIEIINADIAMIEATFPTHPAVQSHERKRSYALHLAVSALKERSQHDTDNRRTGTSQSEAKEEIVRDNAYDQFGQPTPPSRSLSAD